MVYQYINDTAHVEAIIDKFLEVVSAQPEQKGRRVSFSNGYMDYTEGYKLRLHLRANEILDTKHWKKAMIASGEITKRAIDAMNLPDNNFVFRNQKMTFKEKAESDAAATGSVIFDFFKQDDDAANLERLVKFFGRRYDTLSYLFFLKDRDTYFPCRPRKFSEAFSLLGMNTKCFKSFTYENYCAYNEAVKELATVYSNHTGHINTLDAYSFAWTISQHKSIYNLIFNTGWISDTSGKQERLSSVKVRLNQTEFREKTVAYWDGRCAVTGCSLADILEAAHIKSWKDCTRNAECISPYNGLLLTPNLHNLFDLGLISFSEDGSILIADRFSEQQQKELGIDKSMKLRIVDPKREEYMKHHRQKYGFGEKTI